MHIVTPPAGEEFAQRVAHFQTTQRALAAQQTESLIERAKQPAQQEEKVAA